jgi:hypothetical protein
MVRNSELVAILPLLSATASRTFSLRRRTSIHNLVAIFLLVCVLSGRLRNLAHNVLQIVKLVVVKDCLLEMCC